MKFKERCGPLLYIQPSTGIKSAILDSNPVTSFTSRVILAKMLSMFKDCVFSYTMGIMKITGTL